MSRLLLLLVLCIASFASAVAQTSNGESAVRKLFADQTDAWNRGDLDTYMRGYWHSPELTFFGNDTVTRGWQQTLDRYRRGYQSEGKEMGKLDFQEFDIKMLGDDVALAHGRWHLTFKDGTEASGMTTVVLKKMTEGWKIIHDHSSRG